MLDGQEFQKLILAELDAVFRLACHLTRSRQEAEDCVQETFLRALKFESTFECATFGIRPWLFKILHNVINTRLAKGLRQKEILESLQHQTPLDAAESNHPHRADLSAPINWENVDERLKHAIAELPIPLRAVFLLSAVEELKYRQIAEVVDVPIGTVMSRLSRARSFLMDRLSAMAKEQRLDDPSGKPEQANHDRSEATG